VAFTDDPARAFIEAAVGHGPLDHATAILAERPDLAGGDIHVAAILGDDGAVRRIIALDPAAATSKGGPLGWDPLTHLCFSRYLRLDRSRSDGFVRAAVALLDAGASANTGFWERGEGPEAVWECVLYGAAGVAHHGELTRVLLARGADPNDEETPYHAPETYDNAAVIALVESGRLNPDSLTTLLLRKADWHDYEGITYLLAHGADPNRMTRWQYTALHQALRRDNDLRNVDAMLDHGADPTLKTGGDGSTAVEIAARRGRGDVLESLRRRGLPTALPGVAALIAACAIDDGATVQTLARREPELVGEIVANGGTLLAEFAGTGNAEGVRHLLALGVDVAARYEQGDGYFDIPPNSTALHVAAWRGRHAAVRLLLERGAPVNVTDGTGRTPLAHAVRACVDSYWSGRRSPESVDALLRAGAAIDGIPFPSGYDEVDRLLRSHGAGGPPGRGGTHPRVS
jgi:ankyrin repeat protein